MQNSPSPSASELPDGPDETRTAPAAAPGGVVDADRPSRYVARILQRHLVDDPESRGWTNDGTAVLVDISGFTKLSEQLARKGREGAEQIAGVIGQVFESMLAVAYERGGSLIKFGGDALLLWFERDGHAERACRAAFEMREVLRDVGQVELVDARITLQMAQGIHSGSFHFFAVGTSHLELLTTGPAWSRLVAIQHDAAADEILLSGETAALLAKECAGSPKGHGFLLQNEPPGHAPKIPLQPRPQMSAQTVAHCIPPAIRAHILGGGTTPEHRPVTIAFIRFEGTDALIAQQGSVTAADAFERLVNVVETAAEEQGVAWLASDIDTDGGKLILTAGAPKVSGDDEEHMLLALRQIIAANLPMQLRIGVHRGSVFAGDIGPAFRRTYTVMGDAVNLTARVMANAATGMIYATADVLDRSNTLFETVKLEPFAVKGKEEPVQAWAVGKAEGSRTRTATLARLPLTGRNAELGAIRKAFASARGGAGRLLCVSGEAGMGKTRLLEALRDAATGFRKLQATCEAYTSSTPYVAWRELLREMLEFGRDDPDEVILDRLKSEIAARIPDLAPWLPLLAMVFDVEMAATPEVELLAERNRRPKLHETVDRFLQAMVPERLLVEIESVQHMDEASAEFLTYLTSQIAARPWLIAVARRPGTGGFVASETPLVVRVEVKALAAADTLRLAELATEHTPLPAHALEVVAQRCGGNPQFLRDLLRTAIASGGVADLPDSAEAAAIAWIDALAPDDRAVVRHASVFGITFHPRMLAWFTGEGGLRAPSPETWGRLTELFYEEPDGYLRFRRSLLRDAAYEGLPYKIRRQLHGVVAAHLLQDADHPEDAASALSLHYYEAGDFREAWRYATLAAKNAESVYANVEAAGLYGRALQAGRQVADLEARELAPLHQALGDSWYRTGEFRKAQEAYAAARPLVAAEPGSEAVVMLKLSHVEGKLGQYAQARRLAEQARATLEGQTGQETARQAARIGAWIAMVLQAEGRTADALQWAERTVVEAEAAGDPEALGDATFVMGWAHGELGKPGAQTLMERSLEAYQRAGNLARQTSLLSDIGTVCQAEGRWDEALSYYDRGREAALKIGATVTAALTRINAAEILTDRGEWAEAEALLLQTLPLWKASQFRFFLAACLSLLGRVSLRLGRLDEAMTRLEEAKANFQHVGAEQEIPPVDARIAECELAMGKLDVALERVRGMLAQAESSNGVAKVLPLLERMQGHILMRQDDLWSARDSLDASLVAARNRRNLFEATLTMLSLIELDRLEGVEPPLEIVTESRSLLASLKVRAVPPVTLPER